VLSVPLLELYHPVFHYFGFKNIILFLRNKAVSLASNSQPGGTGLCIHVPQLQGGPAQEQGSIFFAFYDLQGYGEGTLTRLRTGIKFIYLGFFCTSPVGVLSNVTVKWTETWASKKKRLKCAGWIQLSLNMCTFMMNLRVYNSLHGLCYV
jgi:hypothetical protein